MNQLEIVAQTVRPQLNLIGQILHQAITSDVNAMRQLNPLAKALFDMELALDDIEFAVLLEKNKHSDRPIVELMAEQQSVYLGQLAEDMKDE